MERVADIIKKYVKSGDRLCVGVSGGIDSMCLLHFLLSLDFLKKENIIAVNIEHGIRGEESVSDSEFVKNYCKTNNISLISKRLFVANDSLISGRSIETEARLQRKEFFDGLIRQGKADKILLAHHADDQCETVLMHIFRGSGVSGLKGMSILSGHYLRPFLVINRAQIEKYAQTNLVPYREDSTNNDVDYNRNFVRKEVLPLIRSRWQGVDGALLRLAESAAKEDEFLSASLNRDLIKCEDGVAFLALSALENDALAPRYVIETLKRLGLNEDFEYAHIKNILSLKDLKNGSSVCVVHGVKAIREYDRISFCLESEKADYNEKLAVGKTVLPVGAVNIYPCEIKPQSGRLRIDFDALPKDAVIRNRKDGDVFKPFGGKTKKLKDYLIDKKIPVRLRDSLPVIAKNERIYVVCGLEISDELKIKPNTVNAVQIDFDRCGA